MRFSRLFILLAAWLGLAFTAAAHPLIQNKLWVLLDTDSVKVAVDVTIKELTVAQLLQTEADGSIDPDLLANAAEYHTDYVLRHLQVTANGNALSGKLLKVTPPGQIGPPEETFFQYELEYPLSGNSSASVQIRHDMLREFPYGPGQSWDVTYSVRWKRDGSPEMLTSLLRAGEAGVNPFAQGATNLAPAASSAPEHVQVNVRQTLWEYFHHGFMHILTGYDHLLFVSALVLATFTFWEMVKVVAAFTLAHTLTLTFSVLGLVRLPSWIVEPVIAASIVFVALENLFFPQRARSWLRLGIAFGFGLIHGLGFAGGLLEAMEGLPALGIGIAIVAFSIGVEVGHQVVVLPLFALLKLLRARWARHLDAWVLRFASVIISLAGVYFLFHALSA